MWGGKRVPLGFPRPNRKGALNKKHKSFCGILGVLRLINFMRGCRFRCFRSETRDLAGLACIDSGNGHVGYVHPQALSSAKSACWADLHPHVNDVYGLDPIEHSDSHSCLTRCNESRRCRPGRRTDRGRKRGSAPRPVPLLGLAFHLLKNIGFLPLLS